ncbi:MULTISPECIES: hypothetical protein [unclassified Ruegeria]|uniref:hypothetical protein n=1 Tax=unclassified Ruegeria TaxID=2625375 RepID=UPI001ADADEF2|nr:MULTISPECIES: hypothetical protein [unclassified Ruegeria]MBO9410173.1 hypothetical protein [Ruegeria sp. R8_1]MBO9414608.1 hypothetical protein [Ruegeria sp. R8_2]
MSFNEDLRTGSKGQIYFGLPAALAAMALVLVVISIWPEQASRFNQEGGVIETGSAFALLAAGFAAFYRFPGVKRLYIGVVCLLLAERELEADVYSVGTFPHTILSGLDVMLDMTAVRIVLAVIVLGGLIWHGVPTGWRALKARAPFLLVFFLAGMSAVVAQLLEEVSGMMGADMSQTMILRLFVLEETLEMFFSIGILAAVLIGWPKANTEETVNDQQPDQS